MTMPAAQRVTSDTFTMTAATYAVFKRVPAEWWIESDVAESIALALGRSEPSVRQAIGWLVREMLLERRVSPQIHGATEIRKRGGRA